MNSLTKKVIVTLISLSVLLLITVGLVSKSESFFNVFVNAITFLLCVGIWLAILYIIATVMYYLSQDKEQDEKPHLDSVFKYCLEIQMSLGKLKRIPGSSYIVIVLEKKKNSENGEWFKPTLSQVKCEEDKDKGIFKEDVFELMVDLTRKQFSYEKPQAQI